jgi:site-specific recombinase XerD
VNNAYYLGFRKRLVRLMQKPKARASATRIHELFEGLAAARAPKRVLKELARDAHAEVAAAQILCASPYAAVASSALDLAYDKLCESIKLYYGKYRRAIKSAPKPVPEAPNKAAACVAFHETISRLKHVPQAAAGATQIHELFEALAAADAPEAVIADLVRDAHSQVAAAELECSNPYAGVASVSLERVYDRLCQRIRLYFADYSDAINRKPTPSFQPSGDATSQVGAPRRGRPPKAFDSGLEIQIALGRLGEGKRFKADTRSAYRAMAITYLQWLEAEKIKWSEATPRDVERFLFGRGLGPTSRAIYLSAIRRFYDVLLDSNVAMVNPADQADAGRGTQTRAMPFRRNQRRRRAASLPPAVKQDARPKRPKPRRGRPRSLTNSGADADMALERLAVGRKYGSRTHTSYRSHVLTYLRWLNSEGIGWSDATPGDVERFLDAKQFAQTTRPGYLSAIRRFYEVSLDAGLVSVNPADRAGRDSGKSVRRPADLKQPTAEKPT